MSNTERIKEKMPKVKTYCLRLTESELNLLWVEMRTSLECGAEDQDFKSLSDKALSALQKIANKKITVGSI